VADSGALSQGEGIVRLVAPAELPSTWNPLTDDRISAWEVMCHLARVLDAEDGGVEAAAPLMAAAATRPEVDVEAVQRLAYRLYEVTKTSRTDDARLFNLVGGSWTDLNEAAARGRSEAVVQGELDLEGDA
jgi:putative DNA methylase